MFRTFDDFVDMACNRYCIPDFCIAAKFIRKRLEENEVNELAIVVYLNWAGGDHLTQTQIAARLKISQQAVSGHLTRLKIVWPFLFVFGVCAFSTAEDSNCRSR